MKTLAQIGEIATPEALARFGEIESGGLGRFLNLIFKFLIGAAGIYAVFNIIIAAYSFMSAGDDPKKVAGAWKKIWQTMLGLTFAAGAFVLAAVFGKLIYGEYGALLFPVIPTL